MLLHIFNINIKMNGVPKSTGYCPIFLQLETIAVTGAVLRMELEKKDFRKHNFCLCFISPLYNVDKVNLF